MSWSSEMVSIPNLFKGTKTKIDKTAEKKKNASLNDFSTLL